MFGSIDLLTPSTSDVFEFCGFNSSGPDFWGKYVYQGAWKTLTPCAEFGFVFIEQFLLLFLTVVHLVELVGLVLLIFLNLN